MLERWKIQLEQRRRQGLYRQPPTIDRRLGRHLEMDDGRVLLNFASNDYLGLGCNERLARRVAHNFERLGSSASSSRLVCGSYGTMDEAEQALAKYFGYESALLFPSGYQANLTLLSTLFQYQDEVFFDKRIHSSLVKGLQLGGASFHGYNHNSMEHLERRLNQRSLSGATVVVSESLFSMDGDQLPVAQLAAIKARHGSFCIVDEAHAFGVLGPSGTGLARPVADVATGTMGKAMGLFGAFILMPAAVRDYLLNFGSGLIYSTTLPEAHAASVLDGLELLAGADSQRSYVAEISAHARECLQREGFTVRGADHILALQVGGEERARQLSLAMGRRGILCFAARYPTVPLGQAILRISLNALHSSTDIQIFLHALKEAWHETGQETQATLRHRNGH